MLSVESGAGISGERPSGKGKFVYFVKKEELFPFFFFFFFPSKPKTVCANPLGKICAFTKNKKKKVAALKENSIGLSCPAAADFWAFITWSQKGRSAMTLQLCPEPTRNTSHCSFCVRAVRCSHCNTTETGGRSTTPWCPCRVAK